MRPSIFALLFVPLLVHASFAAAPAAVPSAVELSTEGGLGWDSNPLRSPSDPFVDYSQPGYPTVTPETEAALFLPFTFRLRYKPEAETGRMTAYLALTGDLYPEAAVEDASDWTVRGKAGWELPLAREGRRADTFYAGPYAVSRQESGGYDEETGTSGTGERYSALGIEVEYRNRTAALPFRLGASYESRSYDAKAGVVPADQDRLAAEGRVTVPLGKRTDLELGYAFLRKEYSQGHAHELDGSILFTSPLRTYTYGTISLGVEAKVSPSFTLALSGESERREENHLGYNDSTALKVEGAAAFGRRGSLQVEVGGRWSDKNFDRAWAYDEPASGEGKDLTATEAFLRAERPLGPTLTLTGEASSKTQESNDKRYQYDRTLVSVGVRWKE